MTQRRVQVQLRTAVVLVLLGCASTTAQIRKSKVNYDRIQVAESFLKEVYPGLNPDGLLITVQTVFGTIGTSWSYVGLTRCVPGYSGVPGGYPRREPDPTGCSGPMQSDASNYLLAQMEFVYSKPHLRGFGAGGKFVSGKLDTWRQDIIRHPDWDEKHTLQDLALMNPKFGPEDKDAFKKVIPTQIIERFSGCRLSPDSATFFAQRLSTPPDTDMLLGWRVSGTSHEHGRPNCSATFEPFEGKLLTILQ
jgi:hypothetical protein